NALRRVGGPPRKRGTGGVGGAGAPPAAGGGAGDPPAPTARTGGGCTPTRRLGLQSGRGRRGRALRGRSGRALLCRLRFLGLGCLGRLGRLGRFGLEVAHLAGDGLLLDARQLGLGFLADNDFLVVCVVED